MTGARRIGICGLFCGVIFAAPLAYGQTAPIVTARGLCSSEAVHSGSAVKIAVEAQIAAGYHVNDHHPSLDYLIPTELKFQPDKQIGVEKVVYPKGEPIRFAFSDQPLSVYQGTLLIGAVLRVAPSLRPGTYALRGSLDYQACNDHACLPPSKVPLTITLKVVEKDAPIKRANAEIFEHINFN